jgi:hypothetical protein
LLLRNLLFPAADTGLTPEWGNKIRQLAEQINAHRTKQQAAHAGVASLSEAAWLIERIRSTRAKLAMPGVVDLSDLVAESDGVARIVLEAVQAIGRCATGRQAGHLRATLAKT